MCRSHRLSHLAAGVIIAPMFDLADAPDPDREYRNYLETCRHRNIERVPRDRALRWIVEWTEVLSGRPQPTTHWHREAIRGHQR